MARFSFVQITDHHLTAAESGLTRGFAPGHSLQAVLRDVVSRVGDRIDFVISTGDLVEPASPHAYEAARTLLRVTDEPDGFGPVGIGAAGLDVPVWFFPGNHDDREAILGRPVGHAAFEHGGVRFVWVDWGRGGRAAADEALVPFLENALATGEPAVVLTHHHHVELGARWLDVLLAADEELGRFFDLVARPSVLAVLSGHAHRTYHRLVRGVPLYGVASTSFQFGLTRDPVLTLESPAYRFVTVDDGILTTRVYDVPLP